MLQAEKLEQKGGTLEGWGKGDGAGLRMDGSCQRTDPMEGVVGKVRAAWFFGISFPVPTLRLLRRGQ